MIERTILALERHTTGVKVRVFREGEHKGRIKMGEMGKEES